MLSDLHCIREGNINNQHKFCARWFEVIKHGAFCMGMDQTHCFSICLDSCLMVVVSLVYPCNMLLLRG
jgi:hypothetical protein